MRDTSRAPDTSRDRDTSRDGSLKDWLIDTLPAHGRLFWRLLMAIPPIRKRMNRFMINIAVDYGATRPTPYSSRPPRGDPKNPEIAGYTSWDSLMDKRWFARYLLPKEMPNLPPIDEVVKLFKVRSSGPILSSGSTFLFPSFAQWFTDGFMMTVLSDTRQTLTCHQIDVNPVYGLNFEQTSALRLNSETPGQKGLLKFELIDGEAYAPKLYDGDGNVKPEFSVLRPPLLFEDYLKGLPADEAKRLRGAIFAFGGERANSTPYTAMLNTLFLREHNRIAAQLEKENPRWDDERVFQTARNINMVIILKLVVEEYVSHIAPMYFHFTADPSVAWRAPWNKPNWMWIEFNLLYRWHSLCPDRFEIGGKAYSGPEIIFNSGLLQEVGLSGLMQAASDQRAWELGLFNTPDFLLHIEKASIRQARANKIASYNDYREAFKFPRVTRFEQISGDPEIVEALRNLYGDVDNIEYFVGLFAEPVMPLGALPPLLKRVLAYDAFTFVLTNPLLSEHVFNENTFTKSGMALIASTSSLQDVLNRNVPAEKQARKITMDYGRAK